MKRATKIAVGVGAALSLGLAAVAVNAHPGGYGPGAGMGGGCGMGYGMGAGFGGGPGMGPRSGFGPGMGPRSGFGPQAYGNPASAVEGRLAYLKSELKITADQEKAWNGYAAQMKQQVETAQSARATLPGPQATLPERLERHNSFMKERVANSEAMTAAVKELYAVLTPDQKAIADQNLGAHGAGMGPRFAGGPGGRFR